MYFGLLCKVIKDRLDSGFHAVDSGVQALTITLLRYLHRQIFNILFCTQNLSTVSSDDVICISGVLF